MEEKEAQKEKRKATLREEEVLELWKEKNIFQKTLEKDAPKGEFVFYEGPPTANGKPGIHHLEARAFKDAIPRYKTMRGYHVRRKGGWDTHGLPVEIGVEKELGFKSKKEIEEYGIAAFNKKCKESVWQYTALWQNFTDRIGYWVDQDNAYVTYHNDYIESLWHIVKKVETDKRLYRDYKVLPWCPRCGTALSSHELAQGYKEVEDPSVYVKFELVDEPGTYFLVWTTTPWTLPSNLALGVNKTLSYSVGSFNGLRYIFESNKKEIFGEGLQIEKEIKGSELVGKKYKPLFNFLDGNEKTHQVYSAEFVGAEEGTGIVHMAPMYGADDFTLATEVGLPKKHLVGEDGHFLPEAGEFGGLFFKQADKKVIEGLEKKDVLFKRETIKHTYPFCWRCKSPLIYYARDSWYIQMSALRDKLIEENKKIHWEPEYLQEGRFGEWLREVKDWAISRERYWGTPLPIWENADRSFRKVIGSLNELKELSVAKNQYLVMRHGQAENNTQNVVSSKKENNHHLTEAGKKEVEQTALTLKGEKVDLIFASPFLRTQETVAIVAQALGLSEEKIIYDDRLAEINAGDFNMRQVSEYHQYFSTLYEKFEKRPPGGENLSDVRKRVGSFIYEMENTYKGKKILIITHEYPVWMLSAVGEGWSNKKAAEIKNTQDDFIKTGECRALSFSPLPYNEEYELDLHRPYIDEIILVDKEQGELRRVKEVMDVWFDSGAMPFAQDHYPFENKVWIDGPGYPADFISEAIDQTRGWFYTLHAVGALMDRGSAYRNVISLGHLLDAQGKKMSKSVGNVIDPWEMIEKHGADALRFWMYTVNQPGESKSFDEKTVEEVTRKTSDLLLNILSFYKTYKTTDTLTLGTTHVLDQWLSARLGKLVTVATDHLDTYQILEAGRALREFIGDFSQWYLRRSRDRFKSEDTKEKNEASASLGYALVEVSKLMAPFMPFLAEKIYQEVTNGSKKESVHLEDWPKKEGFDEKILIEMELARKIVEGALALRAKEKVKVRQPLALLSYQLTAGQDSVRPLVETVILEEVNVKKITMADNLSGEDIGGIKVFLDFTLTSELVAEGQVREFIRAVQDLRKSSNLKPGELASLTVRASSEAQTLFDKHSGEIKKIASLSNLHFELLTGKGDFSDGAISYSLSLEV